jgi:aminocarboxymuconate-semialdehyde decarboxylase
VNDPASERVKVIDIHAHLLPRSAIAAQQAGELWHGSTFEIDEKGRPVIVTGDYKVAMGGAAHLESMEQRIEKMDAWGVDMQVLSLNPILFRYYIPVVDAVSAAVAVNDEIAGFVDRWPDRFAGFGALPLQSPDDAIRELERVMAIEGMVGAAVGSHVDGANWDEPHLFPVLEAAQDLGALIFLHPSASRLKEALPRYHMRNYIANPTETTIAIGSLIFGGVYDRLPDLKMVFAHGGGYACWGSARFDHGYKVRDEAREFAGMFPSEYLKKMWFDSLVHGHANLRLLIDRVGIDRVVIGTDFPADMGQPDPVAWLDDSDLDDGEKRAVMGENAAALLGL